MSKNIIYRKENCPYSAKAIKLLEKKNIGYEDHVFSSKKEENSFKDKYNIDTTPQIFLEGERVGGYTELAQRFGENPESPKDSDKEENSYIPVVAVFSIAALLSLASSFSIMSFVGFALCLLATSKLMDIPSFLNGFKKYDLLANYIETYGWIYPFLELFVGLGFISLVFLPMISLIAIFIGAVGSVSIIKAVYIDKEDLNCACVGGSSNVHLGFVSLTENLMMLGMGLYVLFL